MGCRCSGIIKNEHQITSYGVTLREAGAAVPSMEHNSSWDIPLSSTGIAVKEMVPIMLGCFLWGRNWKGSVVQCNCDNHHQCCPHHHQQCCPHQQQQCCPHQQQQCCPHQQQQCCPHHHHHQCCPTTITSAALIIWS